MHIRPDRRDSSVALDYSPSGTEPFRLPLLSHIWNNNLSMSLLYLRCSSSGHAFPVFVSLIFCYFLSQSRTMYSACTVILDTLIVHVYRGV